MAQLRDRLRRIQEHSLAAQPRNALQAKDISCFREQGWEPVSQGPCGHLALKRTITIPAPPALSAGMCPALRILVPDIDRICTNGRPLPGAGDFLFFDLETSGLSTGAGTAAFLAAFGKFEAVSTLRITQYLLLDYPGENDFLEAMLGEFNNKSQVIASYNGKCFDSQILKARCLMNRIAPPEYLHADLLYPARRLWKNALENCSQGTIETCILDIDRTGDIPGALAPEIWFDFLKTGGAQRLMGICDHNCRDIAGLAAILCAMSCIAKDPLGEAQKYRYDIEQLALRWREYVRRNNSVHKDIRITGTKLLRFAAQQNYPRASLVYALDQLRSGFFDEGRKRLKGIAAASFTESIRAAALRALAIDSERRLRNVAEAIAFVNEGLQLQSAGKTWRKEFERRAKRLEKNR